MSKIVVNQSKTVNYAEEIPHRTSYGVEHMRVTPEIAHHWLTFNTSNRKMRPANLVKYKADMEAGRWRDDGSTICFSPGKLIDGQTRLTAITLSGVTIKTLVVHGLTAESFATKDTGGGRSARDILSIEGLDDWGSRTVGAAIHQIICVNRGLTVVGQTRYTNQEVRDFFLEHQVPIVASLNVVREFPRQHPVLTHARTLLMHYVFSRADRDAADTFFERLTTGNHLSSRSPIYFLREMLLADLIEKRPRSLFAQLGAVVKAWNMFRRGGETKSKSFMRIADGEPFPEIK